MGNGENVDARFGEASLYGWPFTVFFDWSKVNEYWDSHPLEPQGEGFSARDIEFEINTTTQTTQYFRGSLGPLKLQVIGDDGGPARLVVRRRILSCVNLHLNRSFNAPTRMVTQVRHVIEDQGIELCLEIDLEANAGHYDSELRVSLGWAKNPVFYLASAYDELTRDEVEALPYALFFKGHADSGKFIQLHQLQPLSSKVLKPMLFRLRAVSEASRHLALYPMIEGQGGDSFPITYSPIPASTAGVSMLLDATRYTGALTAQDVQDCPSLFIPPGVVRSGALEASGSIVTSRFELQSAERPIAQSPVEGLSFGIEPMVRVINEDETVTLRLLPRDEGSSPPSWWSKYGGSVEQNGWECTFIPYSRRAGNNDGDHKPAEQWTRTIDRLCEYCVVQANLGSNVFTSTVVVLRGAPTGYLRAEPVGDGRVKLRLCYRTTDNEEVAVPLTNSRWNGHNCFISASGLVEPVENEPFCIIRAYDDRNESLIWGVLVLPVPLVDMGAALSLGIG